jgi:hypothetical protein
MKAQMAAKKKKDELVVVNIKMTEEQRDKLILIACKYTRGNLSAWLRHAGLRYTPVKRRTATAK